MEEWTPNATEIMKSGEPIAKSDAASFNQEDLVERLMGDEDLARQVLRGFIDDMPRQLAALALAVNNNDASQLRHVAHAIKGAAGNAGSAEVQKTAAKLEQDGAVGNLSAAAAGLRELSTSFARARTTMEGFCRGR